jgi:hypothetical protein
MPAPDGSSGFSSPSSASPSCVLYPSIYMENYGGGDGPFLTRASDIAGNTINAFNLLCVILYLVLTLDKLRSASTEDARRRLRVLTTGMSIGMGSLLLVFVLLPHFGITGNTTTGYWIRSGGAVLFMLAPLTLAYVVVVQRALDVRVLLRIGTRYALAKATLVGRSGRSAHRHRPPPLPPHDRAPPARSPPTSGPPSSSSPSSSPSASASANASSNGSTSSSSAKPTTPRSCSTSSPTRSAASPKPSLCSKPSPAPSAIRSTSARSPCSSAAAMSFYVEQAVGVSADGALTLPAQASSIRYLAQFQRARPPLPRRPRRLVPDGRHRRAPRPRPAQRRAARPSARPQPPHGRHGPRTQAL